MSVVLSVFVNTTVPANAQFQLIDTKSVAESWSLMTFRDQLSEHRLLVAYANDTKTFVQSTTGQVTAKLRIYCKQVTSYNILGGDSYGKLLNGQPAYVGSDEKIPFKDTHAVAELEFSSLIGMPPHTVRYRFDDDPVRDMSVDTEYRAGTSALPLSGGVVVRTNDPNALFKAKDYSSEFILRIRKATRFRVSLDTLPYAGPTFLDFDVRGAGTATESLPCK
ncbi:MAG: hypothetical protein ACREEK_18350 [Bradyrhizobium sp.]